VALEFRTPADLCAHQCTTFNFAARLTVDLRTGAQRCEAREHHEGGVDRTNRECRRIVRIMSDEFRPIRKNEGFDQIFCVDEDYSPAKSVAAIKGMIPYRPGATTVDPAAPAFVPGAPPPANPTWVHSQRFVPPPAAQQAPRWAPPASSEDADLARALAASRADMQAARSPPPVDADLERALAASVAESYAPSYVQSTADLVDDDADDDFDLRRALAASLQETRPANSYAAPMPAATSYYAPPPPAGPRAEAVALLAEMGISQHLADLFLQQEITRDVAQAVERADLEGLLSEPDIQKFLRWQRVH
jgi:hypothetical protein